jgi:tetratricopeptide (TPR) repeat protein
MPLHGRQGAQGPDLTESGLRASVEPARVPRSPGVELAPEQRGDIYMARKMYREAVDAYRTAPQTAAIYNKIGIAFHEMLQLELAKKNYERAVKLNPRFSEAINNLGTVYYGQKSYKRAAVYYKRSLKYSGPAACAYANLGAAYFALRDYRKSSRYYEQALELDPQILERTGTFGTRMQERTVTDLALFHLDLAKIYAKRGSDALALQCLRKAMEEGLGNRKKIPNIPEFSMLKNTAEFQQLLAENPRAL